MATPQEWRSRYDPSLVLEHPDYRVLDLAADETGGGGGDRGVLHDKQSNLACSYNADKVMRMLRMPTPQAGPGEVLLRVRATGICGSDVHFWKHGAIGNNRLQAECVAGHESAGEVIALGQGVTDWQVGDRVAIEAGIPCGQTACESCRTGYYKGCPSMVFHSAPPFHGTLTRFLAHPAGWLHKLPDSVSFEEGAACEPLAVALAGLELADVRLGDPVLICGAGPIGLLTLLCADAAGCAPIVITDISASRLEFAKNLLPRVRTVLVKPGTGTGTDPVEEIKEAMGMPIKVAMECTGQEASIDAAIRSLDFGGKALIIGVGASKQTYPFAYCASYEIGIQFLFRYHHQYPKALRLLSEGKINVKPLITHRLPLERAVEAFHVSADPASGAIKVQITDED